MSNPNNLIRPPVISRETVNPNGPAAPLGNLDAPIRNLVSEIFRAEAANLIQILKNPQPDSINITDQGIDVQYRDNLVDLDRIPDVVRCLREFSGQPAEYNSWRKSVNRILEIYEPMKGTAKYFGIISVIRNKIVGNADAVLESYNTPMNWESISRCLTLHYADKRDLSTLEYQLTSLVQGNESVQDFYQKVYSHLSLILNKIGALEIGREAMSLLTQTYRDKALDTFVRGLKGDLPKLLGIKEPADLPEALHLCLKLENQNFRTNYANNQQRKMVNTIPLPPRQTQQRPFYPQLAYLPPRPQPIHEMNQMQTQQQFRAMPRNQQQFGTIPRNHQFGAIPRNHQQYNIPPPRPFGPKPQPRPEPMDVDQSLRSRNVNYINRPTNNGFLGKRPPPQYEEPRKQSRNFHVQAQVHDTPTEEKDQHLDNYLEEMYKEDIKLEQPLDQYLNEQQYYDTNTNEEGVDLADIHFLD